MDEALREEVKKGLVAILGAERVLCEKEDLLPYTADAYVGTIRRSLDLTYFPDFVVLPEKTEEVRAVVKLAAKHKIPLLPKGGGSNLSGALLPISGGIVVDTIKMNRVIEVNVPNLYVTTQPGITLKELDEKLAEHGLTLNQVQGSYKVATVGGSISTAGFARKHQKYGVISDRVMSLEVVLADGRVLRTGPKVLYTSTGYRLHQMFIGAEGTLGIITEATLRVEPLPEASAAVIAYFDDFHTALHAAVGILGSCVTYLGIELFDIPEPGEYGAPEGKETALLIDFDGIKGEVEAAEEYVRRLIVGVGGTCGDPENARALVREYTIRWCGARPVTGLEEGLTTYVPTERIEEFYRILWEDIMPRHGILAVRGTSHDVDMGRYRMAYAQFKIGDGEEALRRYMQAADEAMALAVSMGGSMSTCVGVGIKLIDKMPMEYSGTALDVMRRLKKSLDPDCIMNPGKKLPEKQ
jgi:glycolate oxidase